MAKNTKKSGKRPVLGTPAAENQPKARVGKATLVATLIRAIVFLRAIATNAAIRAALIPFGYTMAIQRTAWDLATAASGMKELPPDGNDVRARESILEIDGRDEDLFRLVRASVIQRHAAQADFLLSGIGPDEGIASVLNVRHLLDRLDALEAGPEREATREADHATLATLATRGVTPRLRAELRDLVNAAQSAEGPVPSVEDAERLAADQHKALVELRDWYEEWSEIARVAIKRRSHLLALGLASRRGRPAAGAQPAGSEPGEDDLGDEAPADDKAPDTES